MYLGSQVTRMSEVPTFIVWFAKC